MDERFRALDYISKAVWRGFKSRWRLFFILNFRSLPVPHSSEKPVQMKSCMTFIESNRCIERTLIFFSTNPCDDRKINDTNCILIYHPKEQNISSFLADINKHFVNMIIHSYAIMLSYKGPCFQQIFYFCKIPYHDHITVPYESCLCSIIRSRKGLYYLVPIQGKFCLKRWILSNKKIKHFGHFQFTHAI